MKKLFKILSKVATAGVIGIAAVSCATNTNQTGSTTTNPNTTTIDVPSSTTTNPQTTSQSDVEEEGYKVSIENNLSDVTVNVRYIELIDSVPTPKDVEANKKYALGTTIFVQVLNDSDEKVIVKALEGDKVLDFSIVDAKLDGEAGAGGLFGLELKGDMKITVAVAPEVGTLTIIEDTSKNTQTELNVVHAYNPDDPDLADYHNNDQIPLGNKVIVYEFNYASSVHLTITHNGIVVVDKYYAKVFDYMNGHDEFFEIEVEGDIQIKVENVNEIPDENYVNISITGDRDIAWAYFGDIDFHTGDQIEKGTYDLTVASSTNKGVNVEIKVDDKVVLSGSVAKSQKFSGLVIDGDVSKQGKIDTLTGKYIIEDPETLRNFEFN